MKKRACFVVLLLLLCRYGFTQPLSVSLYSPLSEVDCDCPVGYTGITATASGGTAPYTFLWSNGAVTQALNYLLPGVYTVTVTDAILATVTDSYTITSSPTFWPNMTFVAPTPGMCNGTIFFNAFCQSTQVNAPDYPYFDGYNHARIICQTGPPVSHNVSTIPSGCLSDSLLDGLTIDPAIHYTGPCTVTNISIPGQVPCSNTKFRIHNQHPLDLTGLPQLPMLNVCCDPFFGAQQAKLFDLQNNLLGTTSAIGYMQNFTSQDFDFGLTLSGAVIFEYQEGMIGMDTIGIYLRDTFYLLNEDCGLFNGIVFYDSNNDCVYQGGSDLLLPDVSLILQPGNVMLLTNDNGEYSAYLPFGSYSVSQSNFYGLDQKCPQSPFSFLLDSINNTFTQEIADTVISGVNCDLDVNVVSFSAARPGFNCVIDLRMTNTNVVPSTSSLLTYTFDPNLQFISATNGGLANGNQVTWNQPPITGLAYYDVSVTFLVPVGTPLGTILTSTAEVTLLPCDTNLSNNTLTHTRVVTGSYDPNLISVSPVGVGALHVLPPDYRLNYFIEFENTGTDTAFTVVLIDTLPGTLDPLSIQVMQATHPYFVEVTNDSILRFTFENIMLPDSGTNSIASKGHISFGIDQDPGLIDGTVITNKAEIYFDFNLPVATNTVFNTIKNGPVTICQDVNLNLDSAGTAIIQSSIIDAGSYDFYGIQNTSLSQTTFDCSQTGPNTITFYATSLNGLTDSCQSIVTVIDDILPLAFCHDTILLIDSSCFVSVMPAEIDNGSSDNCALLNFSLSQSSFTCANIGLNQVTFTVTDASGNSSQCNSLITVIDVTGIHEFTTSAEQLHLAPNPSSGLLNLPLNALNGILEITELTGKVVFKSKHLNTPQLDLTHLTPGCYLVQLKKDQVVYRALWTKY